MLSGHLYGDRYASVWMPDGKKLFLGIFALGGEPVGKKKRCSRQKIRANKCPACRKIIIDLDDPEN